MIIDYKFDGFYGFNNDVPKSLNEKSCQDDAGEEIYAFRMESSLWSGDSTPIESSQ